MVIVVIDGDWWWLMMIYSDLWWVMVIDGDYWWLTDGDWWFIVIHSHNDFWWLLVIDSDSWWFHEWKLGLKTEISWFNGDVVRPEWEMQTKLKPKEIHVLYFEIMICTRWMLHFFAVIYIYIVYTMIQQDISAWMGEWWIYINTLAIYGIYEELQYLF